MGRGKEAAETAPVATVRGDRCRVKLLPLLRSGKIAKGWKALLKIGQGSRRPAHDETVFYVYFSARPMKGETPVTLLFRFGEAGGGRDAYICCSSGRSEEDKTRRLGEAGV